MLYLFNFKNMFSKYRHCILFFRHCEQKAWQSSVNKNRLPRYALNDRNCGVVAKNISPFLLLRNQQLEISNMNYYCFLKKKH